MENGEQQLTPAQEVQQIVQLIANSGIELAGLAQVIGAGGLLLTAENEDGDARLIYLSSDPERIEEVKPFLTKIEEKYAEDELTEQAISLGSQTDEEETGPEGAD